MTAANGLGDSGPCMVFVLHLGVVGEERNLPSTLWWGLIACGNEGHRELLLCGGGVTM